MSQNDSTLPSSGTGHPEKYVFETEFKRYEVDAQSEKGVSFQNLSTGPEKTKFLVENGKETAKETGGRIMIGEKGAWRHYNLGQLEYMFLADDGFDGPESETQLEKEYKEVEESASLDEKRKFFHKNATKIREWPERIRRVQNLV